MNTTFLLLAQYEKANIPLEIVAQDFLGLTKDVAYRKAGNHELPFVAIRVPGKKSGYLVSIKDLAKWLDKERSEAQKAWAAFN